MSKPAGYRIELRVNGTPVQSLKLERKFEFGAKDNMTLTGHTMLSLKKGDKLRAFLVPITDGLNTSDINKMKYTIKMGDAQMNIKLERRF